MGSNKLYFTYVLNPPSNFLKFWKIRLRAGKPRPYLDIIALFVKVGARFPRPKTMNIEC